MNTARPYKAYDPGYSESNFASQSQSEDETRRQAWDRRGALDLPPRGPSPGSSYDLSPPVPDLSQVVSNSDTPQLSVPQLTTSALSTNPSLLQYSSVSLTQSDMSLVVSPTRPTTPSLPNPPYPSSESSHPVSLDWDNYASDPQFQKTSLENLILGPSS